MNHHRKKNYSTVTAISFRFNCFLKCITKLTHIQLVLLVLEVIVECCCCRNKRGKTFSIKCTLNDVTMNLLVKVKWGKQHSGLQTERIMRDMHHAGSSALAKTPLTKALKGSTFWHYADCTGKHLQKRVTNSANLLLF